MEITHTSGVEGPKHDPYHWDEYVVTGYNRKFCNPEIHFTVHRGLANWFSIRKDGWKISNNGMIRWEKYMEEMLFNITGMTFDQVVEKHEEEENGLFCPECNEVPEDTLDYAGYPGETIYCCSKCGAPCGSDQNMSAVI
jgi:DNA-directed RNA polymerase subunit RPC12/RpoP